MKAKGYPTYTQRSVAWPNLSNREGVTDGIDVEWDVSRTEEGGVTGSGVGFEFHLFNGGTGGMQVTGWDDGLQNLMDERIQATLAALRRMRQRHGADWSASPADVIAALERSGIGPSKRHQDAA